MPKFGPFLSEEDRDKIVKLKLEGKSWSEIAKLLGKKASTGRGWSKAKWCRDRMEALKGEGPSPEPEEEKPKKEPKVEPEEKPKEEAPKDKAKREAERQVEEEVTRQIRTSDKAPPGAKLEPEKKEDREKVEGKETGAKKRLPGFVILLIVVSVAAIIAIIFVVKRKKAPTEEVKETPRKELGFEGRDIDSL